MACAEYVHGIRKLITNPVMQGVFGVDVLPTKERGCPGRFPDEQLV